MKQLFLSSLILLLPCLLSASKSTHPANTFLQNEQQISNLSSTECIQVATSNPVQISWPSLSGASAYSVTVSEDGITILQTTVYGTSTNLNGLQSGHKYRYTVTGIINGIQSADYIIFDDINP